MPCSPPWQIAVLCRIACHPRPLLCIAYALTWAPLGVCAVQPNAMSTFNFLNMEGRSVMGAMLPVGTGLTDEAKQDISALYQIAAEYNM